MPCILRRLALALIAILALAVATFADPPAVTTSIPAPPASPTLPVANSMDAPLQLLNEATQTFQNVRDYSCRFIKHEQINGQLLPENVMMMQVREQPFSVYLRWLSPREHFGQEVCYVAGRNNNMLRVHSNGLKGTVGFVSLDPRDPRVLAQSRHTIQNAGIGNLISTLRQSWTAERNLNRTQVRIAEYEFVKRKCTRVELIRPERGPQFYAYRTIVYFDKQSHLPVRIESYDWPRKFGPAEGELLECYSYVDIRFNAGLTEDAFRY